MKFLITGVGRSGTGYLSKLFTALGYECGHEAVYNAKRINIGRPGLLGDSSWLAVPYLDTFDGIVIHTVRHPLLVAKTTIRWLEQSINGNKGHTRDIFYPFLCDHLPMTDDPFHNMLRYWLDWNRRIEPFAHIRINIETVGASKIFAALRLIDPNPPTVDEIQRTIDTAPFGWFNHRPGLGFTWDDFPDSDLKDQTIELAASYGYALEPVEAWQPLSR